MGQESRVLLKLGMARTSLRAENVVPHGLKRGLTEELFMILDPEDPHPFQAQTCLFGPTLWALSIWIIFDGSSQLATFWMVICLVEAILSARFGYGGWGQTEAGGPAAERVVI